MWETDVPDGAKAIGYKKLVELYDIQTIPHFRWSYVSSKSERKVLHFADQNLILYIYPSSYNLTENVFDHLEFALRNEGLNLFIIKKVLNKIGSLEITNYIKNKPTGKYTRILWYLYENFNKSLTILPDLQQGTYVNLLDSDDYYTNKPVRSSRHRVSNNLLGTLEFTPIVRKTNLLKNFESKKIEETVKELINQYEPALLARAMTYMYTKETFSSWEIEREKPDNNKLIRFVGLLHKAGSIGNLNEEKLVDLQKNIVDPRFASNSYRDFQNYVGEEPEMGRMIVHYISPKPGDVRDLMNGLIRSFEIMEKAQINPVIIAAVVSFLFVFIHPFEDGNGRLHRFLIHYVLSKLKFVAEGIVFPISASMVRDLRLYDKTLERFSKPLMEIISDYKINDSGEMTVFEETVDFYRYVDLTNIAEYLYECAEKTILIDFKGELEFLVDYDKIKILCKEIVDMPDQKIDLFIKCVRQNQGKLSSRKKENHFGMLTEDEVITMEEIINKKKSFF